jgi:hypothetical protein
MLQERQFLLDRPGVDLLEGEATGIERAEV